MLFFIFSTFIMIGIFLKRNKMFSYMMIALAIFLIAGNICNADYTNYITNYNNILNPLYTDKFEIGYQFIVMICFKLGLTYNQFLLISSIIAFILIFNTVKLFTPYTSLTISLYMIFPFVLDLVQYRNFLSMSIFIYGLRYIICTNKNYFKYIICVLIASLFHKSALIYLILLLINIKDNRKLIYIMIASTLSVVLFKPTIFKLLASFVSIEKIEYYTSATTSITTKLCAITYFIYMILLVHVSINILKKENILEKINIKRKKYIYNQCEIIRPKYYELDVESIIKICIITCIMLPFFMNNLNIVRLYRNLYIIYYIIFSLCISKMKKTTKYYIYTIGVFIFVLFSSLIFINIIPIMDITKQVFNNNIIFENQYNMHLYYK